MQKRKRNLTPADKEAARKLRAIWDAAVPKRKAAGRPLTQEVMAERLANVLGRGTQGAVSQYLNGRIALNYRALLAFADELEFDPRAVRTDLPEQQLQGGARERPADPVSDGDTDIPGRIEGIRIAQVLMAQALARSIPDAGEALSAALAGLPAQTRNLEYLKALRIAVDTATPPRSHRAPKRQAPK